MRLKNAHLLHPVRPPWSTNFTEFLDPRDGYRLQTSDDGWLEIDHPEKAGWMVIPLSNVRCAESLSHEPAETKAEAVLQFFPSTIQPADVRYVSPDLKAAFAGTAKDPGPITTDEPPKRRGRPPKARVE